MAMSLRSAASNGESLIARAWNSGGSGQSLCRGLRHGRPGGDKAMRKTSHRGLSALALMDQQ